MEQIGGRIRNMGGRGGGGGEEGGGVGRSACEGRREVAHLHCVSENMENPMSECALTLLSE